MVNSTLVLLQGYFCVENSACEVPQISKYYTDCQKKNKRSKTASERLIGSHRTGGIMKGHRVFSR